MVPPALPQDWDFYEGAASSGRAIVLINLGARARAPVPSHPLRVQLRTRMQRPGEDGLREPDEAPALFALEDRLVAALTGHADAHFVARVVAFGCTEWFFYLPAGRADGARQALRDLGSLAPYALEWLAEDDASWDEYAALYPNRYALQTIHNRRLQQSMEAQGDRLEVPREVDHVAFFPSREQADAASAALAKAGFRVDAPSEHAPKWGLEFHRSQRCDGAAPDEFVFEVLDLLEPFGGEYDGWGSHLQRAAPN